MSKPWGGIGAWAAEAERAEAEEKERQISYAANSQTGESQSFPSLKEAATAKPKKKKTTMTLSEFTVGTYVGPGGARRDLSSESKGLTTEEMLRLPTGPKERSPEEMEVGRLGGGFRSYGTSGSGPGRTRERNDSGDGSWGGGRRSYGGFDDERRTPSSRVSDYDQPSRADEVDNWAMGKKSLPSMDSGRQNRYDSLGSGGRGGGGGSRADEIDNWATGKKSLPVRSSSNFGSGFQDSPQERPRLVLNPPSSDLAQNEPVKSTRPSPFGAARPREEILAEKGLDWRKQESEIENKKTSRPTSSHSSRPPSAHSNRPESPAPQVAEGATKSRPKVNPFGDAKPREVLLEAQGKDWRKIDSELEHRRVDRPETEEEKLLKEEIDNLKKELEKEATSNANGESLQGAGGEQASLNELILSRERELELLIRELDDKVRFGQKNTERSGSGAGRFGSFPTRSPSQTDLVEEPRNMEFMDRPRSRGADVWTRTGDDRRAFQGGRERGFLANNDRDRLATILCRHGTFAFYVPGKHYTWRPRWNSYFDLGSMDIHAAVSPCARRIQSSWGYACCLMDSKSSILAHDIGSPNFLLTTE
ncbi:Plant specific eukaryotic initiation factor 4B [Macleaya cordata]|uniref:Plant specific eukaryotic initiation factor 4B n=1 Tax=Macleaya cordata TaxID=56857 RepID=A0A200RDR8_MACCD|nr:Plant specific eukaryotic initiation factor 4B [Macleaya cordata]